jgi:hypothetical protein
VSGGWAAELVAEVDEDFYRALRSFRPGWSIKPWWAVSEFLQDELSIEEVILASIAVDTTRMMDNLLFGKGR